MPFRAYNVPIEKLQGLGSWVLDLCFVMEIMESQWCLRGLPRWQLVHVKWGLMWGCGKMMCLFDGAEVEVKKTDE
ncbi:hypothetical protein Tco_1260629 [Tanacetum coccineum]